MKPALRTNLTIPGAERTSTLLWALRIGVFLCFLGHGSYALMAKPEWAAFFGVVRMSPEVGLQVMPWVGLLDLTIASFALASPRPVVFLWAATWCLWTATLRPLTGLGMWEFLARAGNYGLPIAYLALHPWPRSLREWTAPVAPGPITAERLRVAGFVLRAAIVLFLIGHAGLALFQGKEALLGLYSRAGLPSTVGGVGLASAIGWFELGLAVAVLVKPARSVLIVVCVIEMASGLLHPAAGAYWWDFIEHGADYLAPIALILINGALAVRSRSAQGSMAPVSAASAAASVTAAPVGLPPVVAAGGTAESNPSA